MMISEERKKRSDRGKKERKRAIAYPTLMRLKNKNKVNNLSIRMRESNKSRKKHSKAEKYKKELPTSSKKVKLPKTIK